jgi:hypothetical protein
MKQEAWPVFFTRKQRLNRKERASLKVKMAALEQRKGEAGSNLGSKQAGCKYVPHSPSCILRKPAKKKQRPTRRERVSLKMKMAALEQRKEEAGSNFGSKQAGCKYVPYSPSCIHWKPAKKKQRPSLRERVSLRKKMAALEQRMGEAGSNFGTNQAGHKGVPHSPSLNLRKLPKKMENPRVMEVDPAAAEAAEATRVEPEAT